MGRGCLRAPMTLHAFQVWREGSGPRCGVREAPKTAPLDSSRAEWQHLGVLARVWAHGCLLRTPNSNQSWSRSPGICTARPARPVALGQRSRRARGGPKALPPFPLPTKKPQRRADSTCPAATQTAVSGKTVWPLDHNIPSGSQRRSAGGGRLAGTLGSLDAIPPAKRCCCH